MAEARRPRIRKSAPTVRERAEQAQAKQSVEKPRRLRKLLGKLVSPFKRISLPRNRATAPLRLAGRFLARVLRWLVPRYFVNSWREVRLVAWPSRGETWRLTSAVFVFAIVFGALVFGVDKGLDELFKRFVLK